MIYFIDINCHMNNLDYLNLDLKFYFFLNHSLNLIDLELIFYFFLFSIFLLFIPQFLIRLFFIFLLYSFHRLINDLIVFQTFISILNFSFFFLLILFIIIYYFFYLLIFYFFQLYLLHFCFLCYLLIHD